MLKKNYKRTGYWLENAILTVICAMLGFAFTICGLVYAAGVNTFAIKAIMVFSMASMAGLFFKFNDLPR